MEIANTNIVFGRNVGTIASACGKDFMCFRRPTDKHLCEMVATRKFIMIRENKRVRYTPCLIFPLRQSLSPAFLDFLLYSSQNIFTCYARREKRKGFVQEKKYWRFALTGMAVLWDAENRGATHHTRGLIESIVKPANNSLADFYNNVIKELNQLDGPWFANFLNEVSAIGVGEYTLGMVLLTLKVFQEGLKLPEQFTDADFQKVDLLLQASAKKRPL